jgi:SAM-dependent methyltransferase
MIISVPYQASDLLTRELRSLEEMFKDFNPESFFTENPTVEAYTRDLMTKPDGHEIARHVAAMAQGRSLRILDVGVGTGCTSFLLASKGHQVSVLEPCHAFCKMIEQASAHYGLEVSVYEGIAEALDQIPPTEPFDLIVFNASLHHCDDPVLALRHCLQLLAPGGSVLLTNEPILQFFRTKRWFYRRLVTHPHAMGHYGGNEHTYRYPEYLKMLRLAGFSQVRSKLNIRNQDLNLVLRQMDDKILNGKSIYSPHQRAIRRIYFSILCTIGTRNGLNMMLAGQTSCWMRLA